MARRNATALSNVDEYVFPRAIESAINEFCGVEDDVSKGACDSIS